MSKLVCSECGEWFLTPVSGWELCGKCIAKQALREPDIIVKSTCDEYLRGDPLSAHCAVYTMTGEQVEKWLAGGGEHKDLPEELRSALSHEAYEALQHDIDGSILRGKRPRDTQD